MNIRVAYLCGEYPRATDIFIQREVAALRALGAHVETISVRRPVKRETGTEEQELERNRTFYLLPTSILRLARAHTVAMFGSPLRYFRALRTALTVRAPGIRSLCYQMFYFAEAALVAEIIRKNNLSHLHNHAPDASGFVTLIASQMGGFTYSFSIHGFGILTEPARWRLKEKLESALFVICISHFARGQAMLWSRSDCWSRYHVVHCAVDPEEFSVRLHEGRGSRLLFVGRLDVVKALPVLFEAIAELKNSGQSVHLDIAGDGPQRTELEDLAVQLGIDTELTFHGYLSQRQLREQLMQADVAVMTSFYEGIPVVLMEAMASGIPVVVPQITGIPELVEQGVSGFLTPCGDVSTLVSRLSELLDCPEMRNRFGAAGRAKVQGEFCMSKEIEILTQVFTRRLNHQSVDIRPNCSPESPVGRKETSQNDPKMG